MSNEQTASKKENQKNGVSITKEDRAILDSVDKYLKVGIDLKKWWDEVYGKWKDKGYTSKAFEAAKNHFAESFKLGFTLNRPEDASFGYYDETTVDGKTMPIMGNYQAMFYDQPKGPEQNAGQSMHDQIREFVLHYFMRVADFREPQPVSEDEDGPPSPLLRPIYFCPGKGQDIGFGFSQLFYKCVGESEVREFSDDDRYRIVDLRTIIKPENPEDVKYEWVVLKVDIFDFKFTYSPFGDSGLQMVFPLKEGSYLVMHKDFMINNEADGEYGFGYAFIKNPGKSLLAFGPGEFDAAIELINFKVNKDTGKTNVEMVFVVNKPERVTNLSLNPIDLGFSAADLVSFGMASRLFGPMKNALDRIPFPGANVDPPLAFIRGLNLMTGNLAAKEFCISVRAINNVFLVKHFLQHYQTIAGSLQTWRQIQDWTVCEEKLPDWIVKGVSS